MNINGSLHKSFEVEFGELTDRELLIKIAVTQVFYGKVLEDHLENHRKTLYVLISFLATLIICIVGKII